jgi:hypothetical protein
MLRSPFGHRELRVLSPRKQGGSADGARAEWLRAIKGRKIVIVDRLRDRVGEKIVTLDRRSCFVIVNKTEGTRTF